MKVLVRPLGCEIMEERREETWKGGLGLKTSLYREEAICRYRYLEA